MMNGLYYLLEANLYLTVFYGFYRLFLFKETFYTLNRLYLLISSALAFVLPSLQVGFFSTPQVVQNSVEGAYLQAEQHVFSFEDVFLIIYGLMALFFTLRFILGFRHIIQMLTKNITKRVNGIRIVEKAHSKLAFSFFNVIFIDPELPQKQTILKHEMAHINQKHSYDILLFEMIRILNWFNPIVYFLKRDLKLLHEYLADEETTRAGVEKYEYAIFLIQNSCGQTFEITNQIFNSSLLKQRISMLNQKKSAKWAKLRLLLILPLTGGMICSSAMAIHKSYGLVDLYPQKKEHFTIVYQDTVKRKTAHKIAPPPPPVEPVMQKKYVAKPDGKRIPPPKIEIVKFPPPVVKKDYITIEEPVAQPKKKKLAPPPPPIEPRPAKSNQKVRVKRVIYGDPTPVVEAEKKNKVTISEPIALKKVEQN